MKKHHLYKLEPGTAEYVITHAKWRRSRRKNPVLSFLTESNPRQALKLAEEIVAAKKHADFHTSLDLLVIKRGKCYAEMTDQELKTATRHIIVTSRSKVEVETRLREELKYPYGISLSMSIPKDATGREARELVRALGGMVMANGAMAMGMMHGHKGVISL
jgi:hypothetical protein